MKETLRQAETKTTPRRMPDGHFALGTSASSEFQAMRSSLQLRASRPLSTQKPLATTSAPPFAAFADKRVTSRAPKNRRRHIGHSLRPFPANRRVWTHRLEPQQQLRCSLGFMTIEPILVHKTTGEAEAAIGQKRSFGVHGNNRCGVLALIADNTGLFHSLTVSALKKSL